MRRDQRSHAWKGQVTPKPTPQNGLEPSDWKPMQIIGPGVKEIRIHVLGEWRVIYVAKVRGAVYVLHAFQKKTRKTSRHDIDLARQRYRQIGGNL